MIKRVLAYVRQLRSDAEDAPASEYKQGFIESLTLVEGEIEAVMFECGVDEEEE